MVHKHDPLNIKRVTKLTLSETYYTIPGSGWPARALQKHLRYRMSSLGI